MFFSAARVKLATIALFAALSGGCQTSQTPYAWQSPAGLETDGVCVTRELPARDPVTGEIFERTQRFCGGRPRVVQ
jgi:hypothetical protein